jgi:hypothetical protein
MSDLTMNLLTNDLQVDGDLSMVRGEDAIVQDLQQTLQVWLGEWFLDTTVGIPFKQDILVKNPNLDVVNGDIVNAASNVPGVTQIIGVSFDYSNQNRTFSITVQAEISNGQVVQTQAKVSLPTQGTIEGTPH